MQTVTYRLFFKCLLPWGDIVTGILLKVHDGLAKDTCNNVTLVSKRS